MKAHLRYLSYVIRHKWFVLCAGLKTDAPIWRLLIHDWSKFTLVEWFPYVEQFYGPGLTRDTAQAVRDRRQSNFDTAWLHHQHRNPHHWQHWVLRQDDGALKVLEMPESFAREMVADWMGAGRAITGEWGVRAWYEKNRWKIQLHETTRRLVEFLIDGQQ
jgi:hypothetical protein